MIDVVGFRSLSLRLGKVGAAGGPVCEELRRRCLGSSGASGTNSGTAVASRNQAQRRVLLICVASVE